MAGPQDRDRGPPRDEKLDALRDERSGDGPGEPAAESADAERRGDPDRRTLAKEAQEAAAAREMQRLMEDAVPASRTATPALRVVEDAPEDTDADDDAKVEAPAEPPRRARAVVSAPTVAPGPSPAVAVEAGGNKMLLGFVTIAIAAGVGWMMLRDPAPARTSSALAEPPPAAPIQPDPAARREAQPPPRPPTTIPAAHADRAEDALEAPPDDEASTGAAAEEVVEPEPSDPERTTTETPSQPAGDPRNPPPGTPEDIAAAFRKLPVSAADRPPVGAIGAGGIHVDRIWMGSRYENGDCVGKTDTFSVSADPRPSVCIRVVHPREKEEIVVVWEKTGGSARRSKVTIKPLHAYRTRAYLLLRREYVGEWTVRVLSSDGVELASHAFEVVE